MSKNDSKSVQAYKIKRKILVNSIIHESEMKKNNIRNSIEEKKQEQIKWQWNHKPY